MKLIIALALLVALAAAAPQQAAAPIAIVSQNQEVNGDGSYKFDYESADGTKRTESGAQKKIGEEFGATSQGTISWKTPDGKTVTLTFTADENGYQPKVTIS